MLDAAPKPAGGRQLMNRRSALLGATGLPLGAAGVPLLGAAAAPRLAITALEVFVVKVNRRGNWIFVRLKTDRGLTGLGEASHGGRDTEMETALGGFFELIRGRSPFEIEAYRQRGRAKAKAGGRLAATAFSALEQAQWDLAGKALGAPVHALLGGKLRDELLLYANINRATDVDRSPAAFADNARRAVAEGFRAVKAAPFDDFPRLEAAREKLEEFAALGIARVEAIRRAIGPEVELLIDVHSHFDRARSIDVARRLEPLRLYWYEEPVRPTQVEDTAAIRAAIPQRLAGGEALFGIEAFEPLLRARALETVMPDVKHCGGILENRKIATLAEAAAATVSPHNPSGPVATAASVQMCAGMANFLILEHAWGEVPWRGELVTPPETLSRGHIRVPDAPGLGIELNDRVVRAHG
jgi:galactonate dehydratase